MARTFVHSIFVALCLASSVASLAASDAPDSATDSVTTTSNSTIEIPSPTIPVITTSTSAVPTGWISLGCYTDKVAARTLQFRGSPAGALTVEKCTKACEAQGYTVAGMEYAAECFCDNAIRNGGSPVDNGCTMACSGDSSQMCGGPDRLNIYSLNGGLPVSSSASVPPSESTGTATSVVPIETSLPTGWAYQGCYVDNGPGGRIFLNAQTVDNKLTIGSCINKCAALGFTVAGAEYSVECFCDKFIRNSARKAPDSDCSMTCGGNSGQKCGAGDRLSVYALGNVTVLPFPEIPKTGLPGSWKYEGCIEDYNQGKRNLPHQVISATNNTVNGCLSTCSYYGYSAGGLEFGTECYCGDPQDIPSTSRKMLDADCNTPCSGNQTALCGAGARMAYYRWSGAPLQIWDHRTGYEAGEYRFLIGGVVVPLITTVGKNGKVTFLEKFGTGAANTTGAYEFDPFYEKDFDKAWREMHVSSDVFCAAGLVLPDKAARQLIIGGWSFESTQGVRFYTPDGSPGQPSVNDWEENWSEISLQKGRWYPTAMMMSNGSILVVGGARGSDDIVVPSLEILPKTGPVLPMEWLERTHPYSLYPFLAVLPSGGIFAAYWNESRILNQVTFETNKVLPSVPGGVGNPLAGRTYPLEGSFMTLPQRAPYTDPLEIIICGGGGPFGASALDNCITIAPDAPNAEWVVERMPSKRVISCMTALPDGTYLILNGAQSGVAGFQLGKDPNLNALLYDPRKPINQRISIMANTTIARLYHSESVLLQDGRVLVTGSDPLDPGYAPEEYRVEVFMPPYLLSGARRPTFAINRTDWAYGEKVTFSLTSNMTTSDIKVSLMGAESSTHGSTMGQRTIFPEVTCSLSRCTVTAPPNARICPPGWFQLFVLDGPTPSKSQWVRIGGDPGRLGEWPNYPDFTRPGM